MNVNRSCALAPRAECHAITVCPNSSAPIYRRSPNSSFPIREAFRHAELIRHSLPLPVRIAPFAICGVG